MGIYQPALLDGLSLKNRAVWTAFAEHAEPSWSEIVESYPHERVEGLDSRGFDLLIDGEARLMLDFYDDEGTQGVTDEFYIRGMGGEGNFSDMDLPQALKHIADDLAGIIAANDPDGYRPGDVHPLIREEVRRLLTEEYTRGLW